MTRARRRAVVLLSGGLDSGVAALLWREHGDQVALCLHADYGQRAAGREAIASRRLAVRLEAPWQSLSLPWLGEASRIAGSALVAGSDRTPPSRSEDAPGDDASASAVWVPARNVVLVAAAAAWAEALGAEAVVTGFNREEAVTFADNSSEFAAAMGEALRLGTRNGVVVESPTLPLDKAGIVAEARRLGCSRNDFWSCYLADSDADRCDCESCVRSRRAWGSTGSAG